jgi:ABC-type sugar transport system permease subunit
MQLLEGAHRRAPVIKQRRLAQAIARPEYLLLLPGAALLGTSFFYPVISLIKTSFTDPTPGFSNYTALFGCIFLRGVILL